MQCPRCLKHHAGTPTGPSTLSSTCEKCRQEKRPAAPPPRRRQRVSKGEALTASMTDAMLRDQFKIKPASPGQKRKAKATKSTTKKKARKS